MVDIPVEKKRRGLPWLVWLLLLVAIAVAAWYLFASPDGRRLRADAVAPAVTPGETYTSLDQIAADPAGSAGQQITLAGAEVVSSVGSGGLLVADDSGNRIFLATADANAFAAGSRVNVTGTIQAGDPGGAGAASRPVGMPADTSHYILADRIEPA
jgi:hypothetical protein